jgi:nucleoside-diphosphate-sugar epimerase
MADKLSGMAADASAGKLFCFGLGYSASYLVAGLRAKGWVVAGTAHRPERLAELRASGIETHTLHLPHDALKDVTHILLSIPPTESGDPVLSHCQAALAEAKKLRWIGYLSTTGVYGDRGGDWVDEASSVAPNSTRTERRVKAENEWLDFGKKRGVQTQIFRLAGIYGPGRNVLDDIRDGSAKCIERPGQVFSRIHVEDIAAVLDAAITKGSPHTIINVCDDEPSSSADVVRYGCELLGVPPPKAIPFEQAGLSDLAKTFWADNKRVKNQLMKNDFGVTLRYPSYREGLRSLTT